MTPLRSLRPALLAALLAPALLAACADDDGGSTAFVPSVTAADQTADPADEVVVAKVVADGPAWLVIHADVTGAPGEVLGWSAAPRGETIDLAVTLSRDAEDGEPLWAMLHVDEGELGTYEFPGPDAPVTDAAGAIVMASFVVTVPGSGVTPSVTVADQLLADYDAVVIAAAVSDGPGWLVVHEGDGSGGIGGVLGQAALADGANADVAVALSRATVAGETLYAMLHEDAGVVGTYEFPGPDGPVTDAGGAVIAPPFVVRHPSVTVADQAPDPTDEVVVSQVVSAGPGFLVVHQDDGSGQPGAVLGHAAVATGTTADVVVTLDRAAVDGETLYAMLHTDAGTVGTYEFPGPDGPVLDAAGAVIAPAFVVTVAGGPTPSVAVDGQILAVYDEVVVKSAVSDGPGWMVIHEDDGSGGIGGVVGFAALSSGANLDVAVTLDRDTVDGETLYAMLHTDAGTVGTYEFPGPDAPVTDAGGAVIAPDFDILHPKVVVADQTASPASQVTVAAVLSAGPGFLVVHEDDGAGGVGGVIGHAPVAYGANADVVVTLDRDAVDGEALYAMLHKDEGTVGNYEFPGPDGPVLDVAGVVIAPPFVVTVPAGPTASVTASAQTLTDLSTVVSVDEVVSVGPGWMVIHEGDGGGGVGGVLGQAAVADGSNADVEVVLSRPAVDGETLYAMLHTDAGTVGTYEFPGPDGPVTDAGGAVIAPPFVVTVPVATPAVRLLIDGAATTFSDFAFAGVEPAAFAGAIDTSGGAGDPTLVLQVGWRYEIANPVSGTHPLQLEDVAGAAVLLSQVPAQEGTFEADADVAWEDTGAFLRFTLTAALGAALDGYGCGFHASMQGDVTVVQ